MKDYGADSVHSWVVAFSSAWINFTSYLNLHASGVIYITLMDSYSYTPDEALWPNTLFLGAGALAGLISAYLSNRYSIRQITMFGVLLNAFGTTVCFFSMNFYHVCIFYGVIAGLGSQLATTLSMFYINNLFEKFTASAFSLVNFGVCLPGIIFPPIAKLCIEEFGLQGTYMLMGGATLQGAIGAIGIVQLPNKGKGRSNTNKSVEESFTESNIEDTNNGNCLSYENKTSRLTDAEENKIKLWNIMGRFGFFVYTLSRTVYFYFTSFVTIIIVDHAINRTIPQSKAVYLVSALSAAQLFGITCLGWIPDRMKISKQMYHMLLYILLAMICFVFPYINEFWLFMLCTIVFGVLKGMTMTLLSLIIKEYYNKDEILVAGSLIKGVYTASVLLGGCILGAIMGEKRVYDNVFNFLGSITLVSAIIWLIADILAKKRTTGTALPTFKE